MKEADFPVLYPRPFPPCACPSPDCCCGCEDGKCTCKGECVDCNLTADPGMPGLPPGP